MLELQYVDGKILKNALISASNMLEKNKQKIDALNVFPVPDGDTGTNMSLTLIAAVNEVKKSDSLDIEQIADLAAKGSLRGARGNSGVILSQLIRGFAKVMKGKDKVNVEDLAKAFQKGAATAYKAVMKPTEGTILTVARETSEYAIKIARKHQDVKEFIKKVVEYANSSLKNTPNLLPVLKQAGVVDAGGKGLVYILIGVLDYLNSDGKDVSTEDGKYQKNLDTNETKIKGTDEQILYGYCTEFIINNVKRADEQTFKNAISVYGDSVLVISDDSIMKVHIHTNNPGKVLEHAIQLGELSDIKIDNMRIQHTSLVFGNNSSDIDSGSQKEPEQDKEISIIAVAAGDGLKSIFKDLGADQVISGGQTMNPSAQDILASIDKLNSDNVIILPNNSNIIMTAQQVNHLTEKKVHVIPTKTIPQGISALIAFNIDLDIHENIERMTQATKYVKTGQVTYAIRDIEFEGIKIKKGDIIGISNKKIIKSGSDINQVTLDVIEQMLDSDSEIITIYAGEEISDEQGEQLKKELEKRYNNYEMEYYNGGQPVYYYIISIE